MQHKIIHILIVLLSFHVCDFAQCPFQVSLKSKSIACEKSDSLIVSTATKLSEIVWKKNNVTDTTVRSKIVYNPIGYTVAGGNGKGATPNTFFVAKFVFVDADGSIYVADWNNNRVQKFPPGSSAATDGVTVAGGNDAGSGANQLNHPTCLFVDADGNMYVADGGNNRVQKFPPGSSSATNGITVAGGNGPGFDADQLNVPAGIFLDAAGYLYVADEYNGRVQKFPPNSDINTNAVTVAGGNGLGPGNDQLHYPGAVFVDAAGYIYVCDQNNNRVQKFPPNSTSDDAGITVASGGGKQLNIPKGIYVDDDGNLFVCNYGDNSILEYPAGSDALTPGIVIAGGNGPGGSNNQLDQPEALFLDNNKHLFVADGSNNRVQEYSVFNSIDSILIPNAPGLYYAIATDTTGCTDTTNAIEIDSTIFSSLTINAKNTNICTLDTATFTAIPFNGGNTPSYQWLINGKAAAGDNAIFQTTSIANGDIVSCIMQSSVACTLPVASSNTITMTVYQPPVVSFAKDTLIIKPNTSVSLQPVISGNILGYLWQPALGLTNVTINTPVASPLITTAYTLQATDNNGCKGFGKETVLVYFPFQMPTAFSPNGDGVNDVFRVPALTPQVISSFVIYNRWGQKIFATSNGYKGWDGTINNQPAPVGSYIWIISYKNLFNGKSEMAKGVVTLIR